jgi:hypothetical protein
MNSEDSENLLAGREKDLGSRETTLEGDQATTCRWRLSKTKRRASMTPSRFFQVALAVVLIACVAPLFLGLTVRDMGKEASVIAFVSYVLLLCSAYQAWRVFRARRRGVKLSFTSPQLLWAWMVAGFIYLSQDEVLRLHEKMDAAVNAMIGGSLDWIDDAIVCSYGLGGVALLWIHRSELATVRGAARTLLAGFPLMAVMVVLDVAGNGTWLTSYATGHRREVQAWLGYTEEVFKVLAETCFLAAIYHARRIAEARISAAPGAPPGAEPPAE